MKHFTRHLFLLAAALLLPSGMWAQGTQDPGLRFIRTDGSAAGTELTTLSLDYDETISEEIPPSFRVEATNMTDYGTLTLSSSDENVATVATIEGMGDNYYQINVKRAGTTKVTATFDGDETFKASFTLTVTRSIDDHLFIADIAPQTYTGAEIKPALTITTTYINDIVTLVEGTDYTLTYSNNINVAADGFDSSPTVTITGINAYTGTTFSSFAITSAPFSYLTFSTIPNQTYSGTALEPSVTVTLGSNVIAAGDKTYTINYSNNTNAGTGKVTITSNSQNIGEGSKEIEFTIAKAPLTIKVTDASRAYGEANPTFSVTYNGFVNGETEATALQVQPTISTEATTTSSPGTYPITASGASASNYDISYTDGTLTITALAGTISFATPEVSKTFGDAAFINALTNTGDGTVTYSSSAQSVATVDATGTVTIVGAGETTITATVANGTNYSYQTNTASYTLTVAKANAAITTAPTAKAGLTYNGTAQQLINAGTATGGEMQYSLTAGSGYSTTIPTGTTAGSYTVYYKVVGDANHNDVAEASLTAAIAAVSGDLTVTLTDANATYTYDGTEKKPAVTVKSGTITLTLNTDYTVAYTNNINAGTATITVTGVDNCAGATGSTTFTIAKASYDMSGITFANGSFVYDGAEHTLAISGTLPDGVSVSYENNGRTEAGSQTVTAKFTTTDANYNAPADMTATLTITAAAGDLTVTLTDANATFTYDGTEKKPAVTVKSGTTTLAATDYTVAYTNNINAGTATITVTGTGNYQGAAGSTTFNIAKATIAVTAPTAKQNLTYNGTAQELINAGQATGGEMQYSLTSGTGYSTAIPTGTAVGNYTVYYKVVGDANHNDVAEASITVAIAAATGDLTVTLADATAITYDGTEKKPAVTVKSGTTTLAATDYTVAYTNNINAGTATITVTGTGNYQGAAGSTTFTIAKAEGEISFEISGAIETTVGETVTNPLTKTGDGTVTYTSSEPNVASVNAQTGEVEALSAGGTTITATVTDGTNYHYSTNAVSYRVSVAEPVADGYDLWIGDTRVNENNKANVLDKKTSDGLATFIFDPEENYLIVSDDSKVVIESRLPNLTIFLNGISKVERIFYNNMDHANHEGTLILTSYGNIPGKVYLNTSHEDGVISGFSSVTIDEDANIYVIDPENGYYDNTKKQLVTANGTVAKVATIGTYIKPLVDDETRTFKAENFITTDETGARRDMDISNLIVDDILFTLNNSAMGEDGYDEEDNSIAMNTVITKEEVAGLAQEVNNGNLIPGSHAYARLFIGGVTFEVPDGTGTIILDAQTEGAFKLMVQIGSNAPEPVSSTFGAMVEIHYDVEQPTYVYLYVDYPSSAARPNTRIGKKTVGHVRVKSIKISPQTVKSTSPANDHSSGFPEVQTDDGTTGIEEIHNVQGETEWNSDRWYTISGQRIDRPRKQGLYIRNGKKVIVK